MRKRVITAIAFLALRHMAAAQLRDVYVPSIQITTSEDVDGLGQPRTRGWRASIHAFNVASSIAWVYIADLSGNAAQCLGTQQIPPGTGQYLYEHAGCISNIPPDAATMVHLRIEPGIVISASVARYERTFCSDTQFVYAPQGRARLPVFEALIPPATLAVAGDIELGNYYLSVSCFEDGEALRYLRRLNVTLFNASRDRVGTFTISMLPHRSGSTPLTRLQVSVPPNDVRQIDNIAIPPLPEASVEVEGGTRVWLTVSADVPSLGYASTVFEGGRPGSNSFEVFPFQSGSAR